MNKHIHIRDFDGKLHAILVRRAAKEGLSLAQYLRREITKIAKSPSPTEVAEMIRNLPRPEIPRHVIEQALSEARAERDRTPERIQGFGESDS